VTKDEGPKREYDMQVMTVKASRLRRDDVIETGEIIREIETVGTKNVTVVVWSEAKGEVRRARPKSDDCKIERPVETDESRKRYDEWRLRGRVREAIAAAPKKKAEAEAQFIESVKKRGIADAISWSGGPAIKAETEALFWMHFGTTVEKRPDEDELRLLVAKARQLREDLLRNIRSDRSSASHNFVRSMQQEAEAELVSRAYSNAAAAALELDEKGETTA